MEDTKNDIYKTSLYQNGDKKIREILGLETWKLQQFVRYSFHCDGKQGPELQKFTSMLVDPALSCSTANVPEQMSDVIARFTSVITGGEASEEDVLNLKLCCSALKGEFSSHPLIQGLALQCRRLLDKQARGISSMKGRRSVESEKEKSLIRDAGLTLAMMAGNQALAREFGLPKSSCRIDFKELAAFSLPTPALALNFPGIIQQNFQIADQRFLRPDGFPKRFLS